MTMVLFTRRLGRLAAVRTLRLGALGIEVQGVLLNRKATFLGDLGLPTFDFRIVKLLDTTAIDAYQVIVVLPGIHFENGLARLEVVSLKQPCLLELRQHAIHSGQADIHVFGDQHPIDIFRSQVTHSAVFEQLENLQSGECGFEPHALEIVGVAHGVPCFLAAGGGVFFGYDIPTDVNFNNRHVLWYKSASCRNSLACGRLFRFRSFFTGFQRMILSRFAGVALLLAVSLAGCSSVPRIVTEYRIDVQQGNVLTQEMVSQLRPGLTRDQVRFILGTPMLADVFHADRWDYVYRLQNGRSGAVETRKFTVYFDADGKLIRVGGDVAAAQASDAAAVPDERSRVIDLGAMPEGGGAPVPPLEEKGFIGKMMEKVGL